MSKAATYVQFLFEWRIARSFYRKTIWTHVKFLDGKFFKKPNLNWISVFNTSLHATQQTQIQ